MVLDFKQEKSVVKTNHMATKPSADVAKKVVYDTRNLNLWYGDHHGLKDINLSIYNWPFWLWEIYLFKNFKSNGRACTKRSNIR